MQDLHQCYKQAKPLNSIFSADQEKIPAKNMDGCTCTTFCGKWQVATTYPASIHSNTTKHESTSIIPCVLIMTASRLPYNGL